MAKLKSLNVSLFFDTTYDTHPIVIKYKGEDVDQIDLDITKVEQKETITFEGFSHEDKTQKVSCHLKCHDKEVDIQSIATFQMQNNSFVENVTIDNYKDIYFNGCLTINFSKDWLRHNILAGANLGDNYINWDNMSFTDQEVFCVGDSFTYGMGVDNTDTWPSLLGAYNFGSGGLSHDGCVKNVRYILDNSTYVNKIICLLPGAIRKLFEFDFLGNVGGISIDHKSDYDLPVEFSSDIKNIKEFITKGNINDDWMKACTAIIEMCEQRQVQCWISTWDQDMYMHIPNKHRLPIFPDIETFPERASDGLHPHGKHYELFVKNIKPYVDKKQI